MKWLDKLREIDSDSELDYSKHEKYCNDCHAIFHYAGRLTTPSKKTFDVCPLCCSRNIEKYNEKKVA